MNLFIIWVGCSLAFLFGTLLGYQAGVVRGRRERARRMIEAERVVGAWTSTGGDWVNQELPEEAHP